ncbi:tripartite tricarboxylate transporter substrate-binding protein [Ruegeria sp. WL0004]|uniref:Tripartite tricarboxylate transporter substrate-binding protein n=2 Tax=Ruegeria marisflavi TaxID=2984152 RepID=A0ABT2WKS0_9RHOB|nr:tripartite tricarboxylate transporter substrate-binding protein [Ruegeria sp. WL0004]MCU9836501.1 tripartite tricarboxylate transporter substrate-binding protein [Ruegeria sp. WL0004]
MLRLVAVALTACVGSVSAVFADYPEKPVSFIVPWPPGGEEDVLTRMIATEFQNMYGVPAAVVNKPGGGGGPFPGALEVAAAPADGYTVGSFVIGVPVVGPSLGIPELTPNPFVPVGVFMTYPFLIVAGKDAPYSTMEELAAYAQENDVTLGHFGAGLVPTHVTFGLAEELGFEFGSDAAYDALDCNTLASGDVDVMNSVAALVAPCLSDIKVLASVTDERVFLTPDAPTVSEIVPSLDIVLWNGLFVPIGTPEDIIAKIEAAAIRAIQSEEAKTYVQTNGAQIYWKNRAEAEALIKRDIETFGALTSK